MTYIPPSIFKSPSYVVTTHSASQTTSSSGNTFITINGSEITYTPDSNASKVVYEISFYAKKISGLTMSILQLEEYDGSSWSEINAKYRRNFGNALSSQSNMYYTHYRFVLPVWADAKQLRLRISPSASSRNAVLHEITHWEGSSSVTDMYLNTNLLVYSI